MKEILSHLLAAAEARSLQGCATGAMTLNVAPRFVLKRQNMKF